MPSELIRQAISRALRQRSRPLPKSTNIRAHLSFVWSLVRLGYRWRTPEQSDVPSDGFRRRVYASYEQYLAHQRSKLSRLDLSGYDRTYREVLRQRLAELDVVRPGTSVLCLAARLGTEVKAFIDLGAFAVGVDLNPGSENRYVVHGDFHALPYADSSVSLVFNNSLDHVFDVDRVIGEIRRVLAPGGQLLLEVGRGTSEGGGPEFYESFAWSRVDQVVELFERHGFELQRRVPFSKPWSGEQLLLSSRD